MCVFVSGDCLNLKIPVVNIYHCYLYYVIISVIVKPDHLLWWIKKHNANWVMYL